MDFGISWIDEVTTLYLKCSALRAPTDRPTAAI